MRWRLAGLAGASALVCAGEASTTNALLWQHYQPLRQAAHAGAWQKTVQLSTELERRYPAHMQEPMVETVPLGFYTAYERGRALRYLEDMPAAHAALREAAARLQAADTSRACSAAWRAVTYQLGTACAQLGRCYDAERWLAAGARLSPTQSLAWLRVHLALIELDWARGRVHAACRTCERAWQEYTAPSRTLLSYYAHTLLATGRRREAMRAALDGLAEFGVSPDELDRDLLLTTALLARDDNDAHATAELYDLLGLQLETVQLRGGMEPLCALLINQRAVLAETCPELKRARDVEALKQRCRFAGQDAGWQGDERSAPGDDDEW